MNSSIYFPENKRKEWKEVKSLSEIKEKKG